MTEITLINIWNYASLQKNNNRHPPQTQEGWEKVQAWLWETAARRLNLPVLVIRVAVCQETGDGLGHFLVGQDVPQAVSSQHQDVVGSMLALRQRVDFDLKRKIRDANAFPVANMCTTSHGVGNSIPWNSEANLKDFFFPTESLKFKFQMIWGKCSARHNT